MNLLDRARCPRCKLGLSTSHCASPTCNWRLCRECATKPIEVVIFDRKNRFFVWTV